MVKGCRIDTYYVKRDEPNSMYKDFFSLNLYNEFKFEGPNTWKGHYGKYIITVIQHDRTSDIEESDISIEENPAHKENPDITREFPSKEKIAQKLNEHLNKLYD